MAPKSLGIVVLLGLLAGPAIADCSAGSLVVTPPEFSTVLPAPPDPALRPVLPDCLRGLSGPEQENCLRDEIAAYGMAVEAWFAALNSFVTNTNRFANEAAVFANSAIDYAQEARSYADVAFEFANCEAAAIYDTSEK